jgi:hypothetical protein
MSGEILKHADLTEKIIGVFYGVYNELCGILPETVTAATDFHGFSRIRFVEQ